MLPLAPVQKQRRENSGTGILPVWAEHGQDGHTTFRAAGLLLFAFSVKNTILILDGFLAILSRPNQRFRLPAQDARLHPVVEVQSDLRFGSGW